MERVSIKAHVSLPEARNKGWEKEYVDQNGRDEVLRALAYRLYFSGLIEITQLPDLPNGRVEFIATIKLPKEILNAEVHKDSNQQNPNPSPQGDDGAGDLENHWSKSVLRELLSARTEGLAQNDNNED